MALFGNGEPEEFLLFIRNFKVMLKDLGTLNSIVKLHYMCMLLHGEALHKFDTLCAQVGSINTTHLNRIMLGLSTYFFLLMCFQSKCVQRTAE